MQIRFLDWVIVIVYLTGVVGLGCWAGRSAKKKSRQQGESVAGGYFMAAHTLRWPVIGLALFATNISCVHLVSLAQSGYDTGLLNGNFEWMAALTLILLGFFFAPFYLKSKVATLPDFLERRYCRECRDLLAVVSILAAIVFHIAFPLATGWLILHDIFGIEKWTCIFLMCGLTGIYTVVGGLAAVAITETIQTVVLLLGAFVITWFAWQKTGGWVGMTATLETAQGLTDGKLMSMLRPHGDDSGMPWYSILLGYPVLGIWYWCADQTIVQRVLGARSENDARVGPIFCGLIKILPVFIFIVPGLMLYTAIKQGNLEGVTQVRLIQTVGKEKIIAITGDVGGAAIAPIQLKEGELLDLSPLTIRPTRRDSAIIIGPGVPVKVVMTGSGETIPTPAGIHPYRSKEVYAVMIKKLLPSGVVGLLAAALMAALMGNLSSASNSIATMVSYDIVKRFRPATRDKQLVFIGRIATLSAIALGIALVPLLDRKVSIFNALNEIIAHMAPPITCVFLLGIFWPAASARSAKWTLWLGSLLGITLYALKALHEGYPLSFGWIPPFLTATPFMMMAFYLFVACVTLQITFTKLQPKLAGEDPQALSWPHPLDGLKAPGWPGFLNYKIFAAIVIVAVAVLYFVFH
jgi:solute:Na+ symporter, SSS family